MEKEIKNYTTKDGVYYKVTDELGNVSFGRIEGDNVLSTIQKVEFVTKEEYTEATGIEITEPSGLAEIKPKVESDTQDE